MPLRILYTCIPFVDFPIPGIRIGVTVGVNGKLVDYAVILLIGDLSISQGKIPYITVVVRTNPIAVPPAQQG